MHHIKNIRSKCSLQDGQKWATISIQEHQTSWKSLKKLRTKRGFSSKLRLKSFIELGHKAHTHQLSPSSDTETHIKPINCFSTLRGDKSYKGKHTGKCA